MEAKERKVLSYQTTTGLSPFSEWRRTLTDMDVKSKIDARIARLRGGNFGNSEPIGGGASENKIDFGPGYRIYYGVYGDKIILLCGGDKSSQDADIMRARDYWKDYKDREKPTKKGKGKK